MATPSNVLDLQLEQVSTAEKYLREAKDRLNLAETHPVLEEAFGMFAMEGECEWRVNLERLPVADWSLILSAIGSTVRAIGSYAMESAAAVAKLAADHCPNLEALIIATGSENWNEVKPLLVRLQMLKELSLQNDYSLLDLKPLLKLHSLTTLQLYRFIPDDLKEAKQLVQLKELSVRNESPLNIYELCAEMAQLERLDVQNVCIRFPAVLSRCPLWSKLSFLSMGIKVAATEMPYLPQLKILHIRGDSGLELDKILGRSVSQYSNTLLALRLYCTEQRPCHRDNGKAIGKLKALKSLVCSNMNNTYMHCIQLDQLEKVILLSSINVTNAGILGLLRGSKNIRSLDVSGCRRVNKNVLGPLIPILRDNDVRADNPLVLTVHLRSFGDVNQGSEAVATDPNFNLLAIKICDNFIRERPFTVPDPPLEVEYISE